MDHYEGNAAMAAILDVGSRQITIWMLLLAYTIHNQHIKFHNYQLKHSPVIRRNVFLAIFKMAAIAAILEVKRLKKIGPRVLQPTGRIEIYIWLKIPTE